MGEKNNHQENLGGRRARCVSFEGLQSPIQTPEWSCQAGPKKSTIQCSSNLAAMHIWSRFFSGEVLHPNHIGKMVGARGGPQQNPGGLCAD